MKITVEGVPYNLEQKDSITFFVSGLGRNYSFMKLETEYIKSKVGYKSDLYNGIPLEDNFCWVTVDGEDVTFELAHPVAEDYDPFHTAIAPTIDRICNDSPFIDFEVLQNYDKWVRIRS